MCNGWGGWGSSIGGGGGTRKQEHEKVAVSDVADTGEGVKRRTLMPVRTWEGEIPLRCAHAVRIG